MSRDDLAPTEPAESPSGAGTELRAGETIGRYRLELRLGAGAMGVVWSAHDPQLDRTVAIKVVHPTLARSADASSRLLREARAMAKLSHRSVVTVYDAGDVDDRLFLAMELVPGTTLGAMLRGRDAAALADWRRWLAMMIEAGRGLAAAHGKGVLHRDFKPDNVLVDASGRVCVADFGLATLGESGQRASRQSIGDLDLTATGAILGTPAYMSPQQLDGAPIDARADQFAFCVALYEALYGSRPFTVTLRGPEGLAALFEQIERGEIAPAPAGSAIPAEVRAAICRGLAAEPEARWPTMDALIGELVRAARPRRTALYLGAAIGAVAIAAVIVVLVRSGPTPLVAEHLFDVPMRTLVALSPDGKRLLLANDRLEVRELDGSHAPWSIEVSADAEVPHAEVGDREVRFAQRGSPIAGRWPYGVGGPIELLPPLPGMWVGDTVLGPVVFAMDELRVGALHHPAPRDGDVEISPDRKRVAFIEATRFAGTIVVWDVTTDAMIRSRAIESLATVAWLGSNELVVSAGQRTNPTLSRVPVDARGFGAETAFYTAPTGWFGGIGVHRGERETELYVVDLRPATRARVLERGAGVSVRDLDATSATVALVWQDDTTFLAWGRGTGAVDVRTAMARVRTTPIVLDGDPLSATRTGDTLIASLRRTGGREVVARSIATGRALWHRTDLYSVRCAGDRQAPCFALALGGSKLVALDPATGASVGPALYDFAMPVEDIAVSIAGDRIYFPNREKGVMVVDARGAIVDDHTHVDVPWARSLAVGTTGDLVAGGTTFRNNYAIGVFANGAWTSLAGGENDLVSMLRPSPDGTKILAVLRTFSPEVFRLTIPTQ